MAELATTSPWLLVGVGIAIAGLIFGAGNWYGAVNSDRKSFKAFTKGVQDDLRELRQDIKRLLSWQGSPTIRGKSPLSLTKIGKTVSDTLNMTTLAENLVPSLEQEVVDMAPYDIQEFCFEYIRDEYQPSAEVEARIKQCAYDNGLDRDDILDALAIVLRDKLLETKSRSVD